MRFLWPFPDKIATEKQNEYANEYKEAMQSIGDLQGFTSTELDGYLQAAQRIVDYEEKRKLGAEARATAYIAAIATLIPLMTWALGSATPFCNSAGACGAWSAIFDVAVVYFLFAAYWCLRTLAVANYHTIGVEDLVDIKKRQRPLGKELVLQTMLVGYSNRDTINRKLDFIGTAQRCFFIGLMVLSGLLALDPWFRMGAHDSSTKSSATEKVPDSANKQPMLASSLTSKPVLSASSPVPANAEAALQFTPATASSAPNRRK